MYEKNLTEDLRLRLSKNDMDFLRKLSSERNSSISECIRSMIGEYRRSLEVLDSLKNMNELIKTMSENKEVGLSNGDTETNIDDKL